MKKTLFFCWGLFFVLVMPALAADKIGHVDLARLFDEYGKTKEYDAILNSKERAYEAEREKKVNEIKQLQDKFNLLSDKEKDAKKIELEAKVKALQEFDNQRQAELLKERNEKIKEILKDIEKAVSQYAKSQGYTFILNDRILVYQTKDTDITDKVLEILKSSYSYKGK
ncbi:MAG: OmpH family outer membrane protein [Candidatus Omnitrophica bacterium]|nr:OmpH family outer membrane protein [Candidatus Omnitrophota bacterium]